MRILAAVVLRGAMEDLEERRMDRDDALGAMTGAGSGESGTGR